MDEGEWLLKKIEQSKQCFFLYYPLINYFLLFFLQMISTSKIEEPTFIGTWQAMKIRNCYEALLEKKKKFLPSNSRVEQFVPNLKRLSTWTGN